MELVILFFLGASILYALIAAPLLGLAALLVPVNPMRRLYLRYVAVLPLACFAWLGAGDIICDQVYEKYFDRSHGSILPVWYAPLPNGYTILFAKSFGRGADLMPTAHGSGPGLQMFDGQVVSQATEVQISGQYIYGLSIASEGDFWFTEQKYPGGTYFLLDTHTDTARTFPGESALLEQLRPLGIKQLNLEHSTAVYEQYSNHWFDGIAMTLKYGPLLIALFLMSRWGLKLRKLSGLEAGKSGPLARLQ